MLRLPMLSHLQTVSTNYTKRNHKELYLSYEIDKLRSPVHIKADSHIACRANAFPLPCRAAKGIECVFLIWFTQCGRVWFTLAMPCPCRYSQGHSTARLSRDSRAVALRRTAWSEHGMGNGMASGNQTRLNCVNQMGKAHSKLFVARHSKGTAWARHAMCESAFTVM